MLPPSILEIWNGRPVPPYPRLVRRQTAEDLQAALRPLNGVPQGMVASLYSRDPACQRLFLEKAECGVLKFNQTSLGVRPDAPFGGWKASGLGPFEHGLSDLEFYTRMQTIYG